VPSSAELAKVVEAGGGKVVAPSAFSPALRKPLSGQDPRRRPGWIRAHRCQGPAPSGSCACFHSERGYSAGIQGARRQSPFQQRAPFGSRRSPSQRPPRAQERGLCLWCSRTSLLAASKFNKAEQNARAQRQEKAAQLAQSLGEGARWPHGW